MLQIQKLKKEELCTVYNTYMVCDFDKEELKPLGVLLRLLENGLYACYGLFEDGTIQAYACFAKDTASRLNRNCRRFPYCLPRLKILHISVRRRIGQRNTAELHFMKKTVF